ncbi:MAG: hypothetical protein N4A61_10260 [Pelagimonas sp.]|jgi:hypothetical protein|nr:hypothetical protein [Pelagimonas sp.]
MQFFELKDDDLQAHRRKILFVFKGRLRGSGSRYMRCDQLADFVNTHQGTHYHASAMVLPKPDDQPKRWKRLLKEAEGAVVIALKGSLSMLSDEAREELRSKALCLAIDHVDSFGGGAVFQTADLHLAASHEALGFMTRKCDRIARRDGFDAPRIALLDHHADMRVLPQPQPEGTAFQLAYLGDLANTYIPDVVKPYMLEFSGSAQDSFEAALLEIDQAHMHYCMRSESDLRQPKPFTKGFIAARADRNVIVSPSVPDALRFLGEDYPFLTRDDSDEAIFEAVEQAAGLVGSREWNDGLARMRAMREAVMPDKITQQLADILQPYFE